MEIKNLAQAPHKLTECLRLIENSFQYEEPHRYQEDFSLLIKETNYENCYFIEQGDTVVATVFALPRSLSYKDAKLEVLFLGGISVHPDHRSKGFFKLLFEEVLERHHDFGLFFLWSDLSSMYEKFHFYEFGLIEEEPAVEVTNNLSPMTYEAFCSLKSLYNTLNQNYIIPHRTDHDWETLWHTSSIKKLANSQGQAFFVHKGFDLQNIIHESYPLNTNNQSEYSFWHFGKKNNETSEYRYTGFMRLGNLEKLSQFINHISSGRISSIKELDGDQVSITFDQEDYHMSPKDLVQGLWGPGNVEEWVDFIPSMIIFGYDSV